MPSAPPIRSLATLGIILSVHAQAGYALPILPPKIAALPAAPVASNPPPVSGANLRIIQSLWTADPVTIVYVNAIAPFLSNPAAPDNPPVKTAVNLNLIVRQWEPPYRPLPKIANTAPLLPVPVIPDNPQPSSLARFYSVLGQWVPPFRPIPAGARFAAFIPPPDNPPPRSDANLNLLITQWRPPYVPIPKLQVSAKVGAPPPLIVGQIPGISTVLNSGNHDYDLSVYFSGATSYSISPALETGWSFNTGTGVLTIDTDAASVFGPYTVTATNTNGSTPSNAFGVTVTAWTQSGYNGGTAVSSTGVMGTTFLNDATPVPAGGFYLQGFAHDTNGKRYVALWPASNQVFYRGGIASRSDGAMLIDPSGTKNQSIGGWAMTYRGEVIASTSAPEIVLSGYGLLYAGNLCVSEVS